MTIGPNSTLTELAFVVGSSLRSAGVSAVLTGGSAATVYAPDVNQSQDLDFVVTFQAHIGASERCLTQLGFRRDSGSYVHELTKFTLEFPKGPLSIGDEIIEEWATLEQGEMTLQILTPTDCVRDRLSWFLFYQRYDVSALEQAVGVASRHPIDLEMIRAWAHRQGAAERYSVFEARLNAAGTRRPER